MAEYVVIERIKDGSHEYYGTCIVQIKEGEVPHEELFIKKLYEDPDLQLTFDDWCGGWNINGDYRIFNIVDWRLIESGADKEILNKYGIH